MVDMIKRLCKIDEHRARRLTLVNSGVPVMQRVDQGVRRGSLLECAVLSVVEAAADVLQDP